MIFPTVLSLLAICRLSLAIPQSSPPSGAITVGVNGTFPNITSALDFLGSANHSASSIFIYSGIYHEQVHVTYAGPLTIYGQTVDNTNYLYNTVTITFGLNSTAGGGDDGSGTLRSHLNNFSLHNVNVINSFGVGAQALALSTSGSSQGFYGCSFVGHQDTVLTTSGTQFFSRCYIEGATDYIFGQNAATYIQASTLPPLPQTPQSEFAHVFNGCHVRQAASATTDLTGKVFLGRPWSRYARAVYVNTKLDAVVAPVGWNVWGPSQPYTDTVTYTEFNNTGTGSPTGARASFSSQLNNTAAIRYQIGNVLGSKYATWIDPAFL